MSDSLRDKRGFRWVPAEMIFEAGQDVIVDFRGLEHQGCVIRHSGGYVMVRIAADPAADYGHIGERLDPQPTVCVKENKVRHADTKLQ